MNKKIIILFVFALFLSGCSSSYYENAYNNGLSDGEDAGYEEGYEDGYKEGYSEGYCDAENKFNNYLNENYIYENMQYYGIVTIKDALDEMTEEESKQIISIMSNYYDLEYLYGYFVGDYSTYLLHAVDGPCFEKISYENLVLFNGSLDYVLYNTEYKECKCMK